MKYPVGRHQAGVVPSRFPSFTNRCLAVTEWNVIAGRVRACLRFGDADVRQEGLAPVAGCGKKDVRTLAGGRRSTINPGNANSPSIGYGDGWNTSCSVRLPGSLVHAHRDRPSFAFIRGIAQEHIFATGFFFAGPDQIEAIRRMAARACQYRET